MRTLVPNEHASGFAHKPVLEAEVVDIALAHRPRRIVDATVGGGGHAAALLTALKEAELLGLDRDPAAVQAASARLAAFGSRAAVAHSRLSEIVQTLGARGLSTADLLLADLGVSSHQLDHPARGFSFRSAAPLDMRMDPSAGRPVAELLGELDLQTLAAIIRDLGEERYATRVARAIHEARPQTTDALAALVRRVVPKSKDGLDPATRTFQALRMYVNQELEEIQSWLDVVPQILADNGVVIVISFHSLEDRAVKSALRRAANPCRCPPALPVCRCGLVPTLKLLGGRAVRPTVAESASNPRAASARMRVAQRLPRGS
ncbi:MAG: 16S rRNA (cytosine(1402)-N(4))-methyltransferase RsmH [Deltaproteobacteria bacterium]|nr:16S rRNA (cytosine(1402)-N(4))-methyltransferase RsmH [Deltaproteobacteria bacterium]